MPPKFLKQLSYLLISVFLTLGLSLSVQSLLAAWDPPLANPPACVSGNPGCDAPLNESATNQAKLGGLGIGGKFVVSKSVNNDYAAYVSNGGGDGHGLLIKSGDASGNFPILNAVDGSDNSRLWVANGGNVGIGTNAPSAKLEVAGQIKITDGSQGANKVLTSNAAGLASWVTPAAVSEADTLQTVTTRGNATNLGLAVNGPDINHNANNVFSVNSYDGLQLRINSDGAGAANFQINNSGNTPIITATNAGNVGIGTNAPDGNLHIYNGDLVLGKEAVRSGYVTSDESIYFNTDRNNNETDAYFVFGTNRTVATGGSELMRIKDNGNVGIGTTNPQGALDLGSGSNGKSIIWGGGTGTNHYDSIGARYSSADLALLKGLKLDTASTNVQYSYGAISRAGILLGNGNGDIHFFNKASSAETVGNTFDFAANTKLVIKENGNVGIGTNVPGAKLEVAGQIKITGGAPGANKVLTSDAAGVGSWVTPAAVSEADTLQTVTTRGYTMSGQNIIHSADNMFFIDSQDGLQLRINSNGGAANFQINNSGNTPIITATNGGNVGIGTTAIPAEKLEVVGSIQTIGSTAGSNRIVLKHTSATPRTWEWYPASSESNSLDLYERVGGKTLISFNGSTGNVIFNSGGNVGIGTNAPNNLIQVANLINFDNAKSATFLGYQAGYFNTTGNDNTFLGNYAGYNNTVGSANAFLGRYAGYDNTAGDNNTFLGGSAGSNNTTGSYNSFLGSDAGFWNTSGSSNVILGRGAGYNNTTGSSNVIIGSQAGINNTVGWGNVFIGNEAGTFETGSGKLYIDNTSTDKPLIGGRFDTNRVSINGNMDVYGTLTATVKPFKINHPTKPDYFLYHVSIEGPEAAVFYRGEAKLVNGQATIELPEYFDALTREGSFTVQLTAKGKEPYSLSAGEISGNKFKAYGEKSDGNFYWEVKATRADIPPFPIEVPKKQDALEGGE